MVPLTHTIDLFGHWTTTYTLLYRYPEDPSIIVMGEGPDAGVTVLDYEYALRWCRGRREAQ